MTDKIWAQAVRRFNGIMMNIGYEHNTIGTCFSEDTDDWNLRDLVAEADYTLSTYYENGHVNADMRYGEPDERKMWRSETGRLKRFIEKFEPYIGDLKCAMGHCSAYDN